MRIAIVTPFPPQLGGGVERFTFLLKASFEQAGHAVKIFDSTQLPGGGDGLLRRLRIGEPKLAYELGKRFEQEADQFDLVICNGMFGWNIRFQPSIVIFHGNIAALANATRRLQEWHTYLKFRYGYCFFHFLSGRGKTVVTVSQATARQTEDYYGLPVTQVIPNGVDTARFQPNTARAALRQRFGLPQEPLLALFVGRPSYQKGFDVVRRIANSVGPDVQMVAALPGGSAPTERAIRVLSDIPYEQMPDLYNACDVFLLPSRDEGCSYSLLEAMACGLPVVASRVGYAVEIANRDSALASFFLRSWNYQHYRRKLQQLQSSVALRTELGARAWAHVLEYNTLERFGSEYVALAESIVQETETSVTSRTVTATAVKTVLRAV